MSEHRINLDGLSVCIGMPAARDIPPLTVKSLLGTYSLCHTMGIPCQLAMVSGNAVIQWARDEVVDLFLKTDANRLFWIDSDMVWEPEDFMRLLALSQKRDVVCGTYTAKKDQPTFYVLRDEAKELTTDDLGLLDIYGLGMGFFVMAREVVAGLYDNAPKIYDEISGRDIAQIFKVGRTEDGKREGEDMAFFRDIRGLGYTINLDPSISLGHSGTKIYKGSIMDALRIEN